MIARAGHTLLAIYGERGDLSVLDIAFRDSAHMTNLVADRLFGRLYFYGTCLCMQNTTVAMLAAAMPEGPKYFPDDMMTDQPERVLCAEIIREKALWNLRDEVPHGVGVEMLSIKEVRPGLTEIHANIYCERASHKSIIIGRQGSMLGKIGSEARRDIERLLGTQVLLKLWVKVREDWRNRAGDLRALGYEDS